MFATTPWQQLIVVCFSVTKEYPSRKTLTKMNWIIHVHLKILGVLVSQCVGHLVPWCLDWVIPWFSDCLIPWFLVSLLLWSLGSLIPWLLPVLILDFMIQGCHGSRILWSLILWFLYFLCFLASLLHCFLGCLILCFLASFSPYFLIDFFACSSVLLLPCFLG